MKEIWKKLDEYHNISNTGKIVVSKNYNNYKKGYELKCWTNQKGYKRIRLNGKTTSVHRLVAKFFVLNDNPQIKTEVNHINFNRTDNNASNLQWCSHSENVRHSAVSGRYKNKKAKTKKVINKTTGEMFESCKIAAIKYNTTPAAIRHSLHGHNRCCNCDWAYL